MTSPEEGSPTKPWRWMLVSVLALTATCLLALQLVYRHDATPPPARPAVPAGPGGPTAAGSPPAAPEAPRHRDAGSAPELASPATPPDRARELAVNDCVERKALAGGVDRIRPSLPGRWPALKRAREVQRLRRLELRVQCQRELATGL